MPDDQQILDPSLDIPVLFRSFYSGWLKSYLFNSCDFEKVNGFAINCRISDSKGHSLMYNLQKRILECTLNPESLQKYYAQDLARSVVWDF